MTKELVAHGAPGNEEMEEERARQEEGEEDRVVEEERLAEERRDLADKQKQEEE